MFFIQARVAAISRDEISPIASASHFFHIFYQSSATIMWLANQSALLTGTTTTYKNYIPTTTDFCSARRRSGTPNTYFEVEWQYTHGNRKNMVPTMNFQRFIFYVFGNQSE